ncbi:unnamed protein product [Eruca vesicaria subsp. sativa]|uniref:Uncharacterized protein n=1 Tax=Eruca vesicaria subsp. sativa TaxID=29727 RepID=A0ABC8L268_ERUVS|nr:unnamed protein product [Eruca vesicaria subsp. sativa]
MEAGSTDLQGGDLAPSSARDAELIGVEGGSLDLAKDRMHKESVSGNMGAFNGSPDSGKKTDSLWLKKSQAGTSDPLIEVDGGVASMRILDDIFDESELLWKSFVAPCNGCEAN